MYKNETTYLDEVERLTSWCQDNCLSLNVSKTNKLIVDFRKRQQQPYTPLMISGTPVERVSSFKYLGVNISEDLSHSHQWNQPPTHAQSHLINDHPHLHPLTGTTFKHTPLTHSSASLKVASYSLVTVYMLPPICRSAICLPRKGRVPG